jgi:type II secretory pathway pseudopilin PulG
MKSSIIKLALGVVIIVLGYFLYSSIMKPVRFQEEVNRRNEQIVNRMKDIRTAQTLYKQFNNQYTSSFDTLINFLKTAEIPVVKMVPDPNDTTFSRSITDTVGYVSITDSLYSKRPNFKIEDLAVIPFSDGRRFEIKTDKIDKGGVMVSVLEIEVPYEYYLYDMKLQDVVNLADRQKRINKFPGIKMGSLTEASTDGNWE